MTITESLETEIKRTSVKRLVEEEEERGKVASSFKKLRPTEHPRWHNQSYMLFLALRQHPDHCLPRAQLINSALELDIKISAELGLPRVFRSKTPANSASASLTVNSDRYFIPFKPEGSKSTWFKLAYEPGDEGKAVQEYQKWMKKLIEHDWPYCFGIPKVIKEVPEDCQTPPVTDTEMKRESIPSEPEAVTMLTPISDVTEPFKSETDNEEKRKSRKSPSLKTKVVHPPMPTYTLDELDLSDIPGSWKDIVYVAPSRIPGAGLGLFAKRKLPYNAPIGFYFGVPMTEDEFDSLKDRVGRSSEYSIMYRRTVLDATDESGQPVTDPENPRYCPFHFMNESDEKGANILFVEGVVVNQVICWTKRDIQPDEELFVWYGRDVDRHWGSRKKKRHGQTDKSKIATDDDGSEMNKS
ncbi:hypothetical protein BCV72DRAFT_271885 [Rhizopus microsporus var. microsporus]|nr:hypothetical protein BCV72DRAFT_271885 [Rhizopus microsporus var. microsporus]